MKNMGHRSECMGLIIAIVVAAMSLMGCGDSRPEVPDTYTTERQMPTIMPDYTEVTVPTGICPLNFCVLEAGKETVVRMSLADVSYTYGDGMNVRIDSDEWQKLCTKAKDSSIKVEVFVSDGNTWRAYAPFNIYVAPDSIDRYISYRLIQPSYVSFEHMSIAQRDITSFDETVIYDNKEVSTESSGQCVNCHSYQNYHTDRMLFHMRQAYGGTMIVDGDRIEKVDTKTEQTISAGAYPAWHPTQNLVAFSTNLTGQTFHTKSVAKVEVQDTKSDLIMYDVARHEVSIIANDSDELEVFPTWSPDGRTLYYCSAYFPSDSTGNEAESTIVRYREIHYNIYAKDFNPETHEFSPHRLVYDAASVGKSASLPRVSPDGKYMVFSLGYYGCFHIWHPESDIYMLELNQEGDSLSRTPVGLDALNSKYAESYPSFSSNGRWIMTASRRDDGNYSRVYISYFDRQGKCHKAFELPQSSPSFYVFFMKSYNRPEFMVEPVKVSSLELVEAARKNAVRAKFVER